ncbi:hypothetical protein ACHAWT_000522 [Skeletonema menzelii]
MSPPEKRHLIYSAYQIMMCCLTSGAAMGGCYSPRWNGSTMMTT